MARALDAQGHDVTVIDEKVKAFDRLGNDFNGNMVVGTGIDESLLRRAGIESADVFASVTNGDNRNIMAAQIAQVIFKVPRVITRIYDPIREEVYRDLGLETVCSTRLIADLMIDYVLTGVNHAHERSAETARAVAARAE
jgi:trk system potassium uptake protein TrkA